MESSIGEKTAGRKDMVQPSALVIGTGTGNCKNKAKNTRNNRRNISNFHIDNERVWRAGF